MFVSSQSKGAGFKNGLILFALVFFACLAVAMVVKIKKDPKDPDGYRNTLGLKKKKA